MEKSEEPQNDIPVPQIDDKWVIAKFNWKTFYRRFFRDNLLEINNDLQQCRSLKEAKADMSTSEMYSKFDFNASWIKNKGIWSEFFENRWKEQKSKSDRPPLHVVVMPHSHNDPGWLQTFEGYFGIYTKNILNTAVDKLPNLPEMSFLWTEISFLALWFESASEKQKETFKNLVKEGRIEITTGACEKVINEEILTRLSIFQAATWWQTRRALTSTQWSTNSSKVISGCKRI